MQRCAEPGRGVQVADGESADDGVELDRVTIEAGVVAQVVRLVLKRADGLLWCDGEDVGADLESGGEPLERRLGELVLFGHVDEVRAGERLGDGRRRGQSLSADAHLGDVEPVCPGDRGLPEALQGKPERCDVL